MKPLPSRLWAYVRPHIWMLVVSLCLVAVVGLLEAATPFLIGLIFDTLLRASATPTIAIPFVNLQFNVSASDGRIFLVLLIIVTAVKAVAEFGSINVTAYLGQAVVRDLRNDLFERILLQPLHFFHFNPTGELISRVSADVERIQTAASETLAEFLKQAAILVCRPPENDAFAIVASHGGSGSPRRRCLSAVCSLANHQSANDRRFVRRFHHRPLQAIRSGPPDERHHQHFPAGVWRLRTHF